MFICLLLFDWLLFVCICFAFNGCLIELLFLVLCYCVVKFTVLFGGLTD